MRYPIFRALITVLIAAGVVFGLVYLGQYARQRLDERQQYTAAFGDLRCPVPPGMDRTASSSARCSTSAVCRTKSTCWNQSLPTGYRPRSLCTRGSNGSMV